MTEQLWVMEKPDAWRDVMLECECGRISVTDQGPTWSEAELINFARRALSARTHCRCFGQRVYLAPSVPDHLECEVHLFGMDLSVDPTVETTRPLHLPPRAVSLAASRVYESGATDEHPLAVDRRLVAWWLQQRDLGLLRPD